MSIVENGHRIGRAPSLGSSGTSVMEAVVKNPDLQTDTGWVIEGINKALSTYKRTLYQAGIRPIEIMHKVDQIKNRMKSRKRAMKFIQVANSLVPQNGDGNGNGNGGEIK